MMKECPKCKGKKWPTLIPQEAVFCSEHDPLFQAWLETGKGPKWTLEKLIEEEK